MPKELRSIEGVRNFGAHIGRAEAADEVVGPNFTELLISIDEDVDYEKTVADVQEVVDGYLDLSGLVDLSHGTDQRGVERCQRSNRGPHLWTWNSMNFDRKRRKWAA
ncbi:MAG: hypothetical protein R3C02_03205 [Planctomycetaceae bacterium]